MNSDNVYMINEEGQIVLVPNEQDVSLQTNVEYNVQNTQKTTVSNRSSQINPVIAQNNPITQPSVSQNSVRNIGGIRYTQSKPQVQQQVQQAYQRPQVQQVQQQVQQQVYQRPQQVQQVYQRPQVQQQVYQQVQQQVYQRPQVQPGVGQSVQAPVLNTRKLNTNRQEESQSYNNWKKMNLNLTQMVNEHNPHQQQVKTLQQNEEVDDINEDVNFDVDVDMVETNQPEFVANSNRAKYGTFISNITSHNTKNNGSIRSKNIPSYLAIRKAHNSESIYL